MDDCQRIEFASVKNKVLKMLSEKNLNKNAEIVHS